MSLDRLRKKAALFASVKTRAAAPRAVPGALHKKRLLLPPQLDSQRPGARTDPFEKLRKRAMAQGCIDQNPVEWAEIQRIIGLPIIPDLTPEEAEEFCRTHILAKAFLEGWRLWEVQCSAVAAFEEFSGLFAPIGVGWGKTLVTQMIADSAYRAGMRKILLLVPSPVLGQLIKTDFPFARRRISISYPVHIMGNKTMAARRALARSNKKGLYIMPYSCLSTKDTVENLEAIRPELIICDEADQLGNPRAARTKRIMNYIHKYEPKGCVLSGTITSKSIKDYYHLIKWVLDTLCPLPLSGHLATEWATKIDSAACSSDSSGPIRPLVDWAIQNFPDEKITEDTTGFRLAYRLRLRTTPGVVATGDAEIGPSLIVHNSPVKDHEQSEGWDKLEELRKQVVEAWLTPNGDEIQHAIHTYKWLYELTAGFYNELTFPTPEQLAERENIPHANAEQTLEAAHDHYASGQAYSSELRGWIEDRGRPGLDTPMLVGLDIFKNGPKHVGDILATLWQEHKDTESALRSIARNCKAHKGSDRELSKKINRSFRDSRIIRVCPYKIDHAVDWAKGTEAGGIIWIYHKGIGRWVTEELHKAGVGALYCPAGDNESILDPANRGRIIVASIRAHGMGKNLQAFHEQLFLQWPRSAKIGEQALGRMHRNGQESSEVWAHTCTTTEFDELCFAACLNDALYIHQSTGNRQKLIYCTYSPKLPRIVSPGVLRERGFQNKQLDTAQVKFLQERFGKVSES